MKVSQVLLLPLALAIGLMVGRKTVEAPPAPAEEAPPAVARCEEPAKDVSCAEFENFKSHLQGVTPEEIRAYLRAQSAEEKLKKADEILAKIMQVLVADIGFRLQKEEVDQLGKVSKSIDNQPPPVKENPVAENPKPKRENPQRIRTEIRNARSEEQASRVLKDLGTNFSERLQQSGPLTRDQLRNLNGHFEGTLSYLKPAKQVRMSLDFQGRLSGKNLEGEAQVLIYSEDGKVNSQARSQGNLSPYSATENSVFIKISGNYLELVYFPNLDLWMGNYLEDDRGLLKPMGNVVLKRQ